MDKNLSSIWKRLCMTEVEGHPVWFWAAMAAVPLYFGLLVEQLGVGDAALPVALWLLIAGGAYFLVTALWRKL